MVNLLGSLGSLVVAVDVPFLVDLDELELELLLFFDTTTPTAVPTAASTITAIIAPMI